MDTTVFLQRLRQTPHNITFKETMGMIDANYSFVPTGFTNGSIYNQAGQNSGSCKIFAFAKLEQLTKEETLHCFGDYYRLEVLLNPQGTDHQNIRNFMQSSWDELTFEGSALQAKAVS